MLIYSFGGNKSLPASLQVGKTRPLTASSERLSEGARKGWKYIFYFIIRVTLGSNKSVFSQKNSISIQICVWKQDMVLYGTWSMHRSLKLIKLSCTQPQSVMFPPPCLTVGMVFHYCHSPRKETVWSVNNGPKHERGNMRETEMHKGWGTLRHRTRTLKTWH